MNKESSSCSEFDMRMKVFCVVVYNIKFEIPIK